MNPKVFSERATFTIKKDKAGEIASTIEEKQYEEYQKWQKRKRRQS